MEQGKYVLIPQKWQEIILAMEDYLPSVPEVTELMRDVGEAIEVEVVNKLDDLQDGDKVMFIHEGSDKYYVYEKTDVHRNQ